MLAGSVHYYATSDRNLINEWFSCDELLVCHGSGIDKPDNRVTEHEIVAAVVVSEGRFVEVGRKMLGAELMVGANDRPLKQAPDALNGVGVNLPMNPLVPSVVDRLVLRVLVPNALVAGPFVRVDFPHLAVDVVLDEAPKGLVASVRNNLHTDAAPALCGSDYDHLAFATATSDTAAPTSDERLINLNDVEQAKSRPLWFHRGADAMAEIPSGLIADLEHPLELVGRDSLLGLAHHVDRKEPLPERELGIVKDGPDADAELVATSVTIELTARHDPGNLRRLATWAANAIRPAKMLKVLMALILAVELPDKLCNVHFHGVT